VPVVERRARQDGLRVVGDQGRAAPPEDRGTVQSVERSLELFERLVATDQELGLRELSEASGLPVGTVHRLLAVLVGRGYVRQNPATRRYTVGFTALDLAERIRSRGGLAAQAQPFLRELVRLTGESANLAVLDGAQAVYLAQMAPRRLVRMVTEVGNRAPLYASGTGKLLLAHRPIDRREALLAQIELRPYTQRTIDDRERLRIELDRIREQGYARDDGEFEEGVQCVALPVRDASKQVVAAFSVSGPSSRLTRERADAWLPEMKQVALDFSRALGF
jgi:IclR family transcriptional regulator, acetate operon repressor